jgi:hypothetical protein
MLEFLLRLALEAPALAPLGAKAYADLAHGSGGVPKVKKGLADLAAIFDAIEPVVAPAAAPVGTVQGPQ